MSNSSVKITKEGNKIELPFELTVHRRHLARCLARYELFKKVLDIKGSIVECGVHNGAGLLTWAKLSSIFEPYAIHRKVIGFDTFEGFPSISQYDTSGGNPNAKKGAFHTDDFDMILGSVNDYDQNRYLNQFNKIELLKGDAVETIPSYLEKNEHLIVSLLYLDFDIYDPTKVALQHLLPRMPKGSIIAFDQINNQGWPGETKALIEEFGSLNSIQINKFHFDTNIAYIVL